MTVPVRWQPVAAPPALAAGDLHLWRIRTGDGGAALDACLALLGERQRARALRMTHPGARDRYVRSQAGLRQILGLYLGFGPASIVYGYGPAGKPGLAGECNWLEFNLTTTGDLALVGLSRGMELGVDCEWIRPRRDIESVARKMLDPRQVETLIATPEPERLAAFYRAWTALEADAKRDGRGLFRPRPPGARAPQVRHCIPEPGYVAAVARVGLPVVDRWQTLELAPDDGQGCAA